MSRLILIGAYANSWIAYRIITQQLNLASKDQYSKSANSFGIFDKDIEPIIVFQTNRWRYRRPFGCAWNRFPSICLSLGQLLAIERASFFACLSFMGHVPCRRVKFP